MEERSAQLPILVEARMAEIFVCVFMSDSTPTDRGHPHTISLKLRDMNQLFNSMDPSPFIEKDLDDDAEEFIVSWAQEFSPKAPTQIAHLLGPVAGRRPQRTDQDGRPQPLCSSRQNH